jgi:uridine kinase
MVQVYCKNTQETKRFPEGTSLLQMLSEFDCHRPYPIVSAKVNNVSQGLKFKVYQNKDIEFIDVRESSGMRVYCRSLCFLLYKAASDMFPGSKLYMEHPISHGYFCHLRKADDTEISAQDLVVLERRMKELVEKDMPFHR